MATVYTLGSNGSGQLGIGHTEDVSVPKPILWNSNPPNSIAKVAAGGNHTLILSQEGALYWSGDSTSGACGLVDSTSREAQHVFSELKSRDNTGTESTPRHVQMIAATWEASTFTTLDDQGGNTKIYTSGSGQKGELGQGALIIRDARASQLKDFPPVGCEIVDLSAGMSHVVVVLSNGDVYGWGSGRKGQLGSHDMVVFSPRKIEGVGFEVKRAVCGKDFTCLLGESGSGRVCVLGTDKWGVKSEAPQAVPGWGDIGAGWGNVVILKKDGELVAWGRNDYSQSVSPTSEKVSKIAVGSEHVLALLETGKVLAWGWGEHGNCGPLTKRNDGGKGQLNIIASTEYLPPGVRISAIGAGCATSWVVVE